MGISAYKEITEWDNDEFIVPNHTYLFDGKSNILAYAKEFEQIPVLNSEHKVNIGNKLRKENSYSQIRRRQIQDNLEEFFA